MTAIPADPVALEQLPPADLYACEHCNGAGIVVSHRDGVEVDHDCTWCDGSGDRRAPLGTPVIRCRRIRAHGEHTYVETPNAVLEIKCPGRIRGAASLGELLQRRPELGDVTAVAFCHVLAVSAA